MILLLQFSLVDVQHICCLTKDFQPIADDHVPRPKPRPKTSQLNFQSFFWSIYLSTGDRPQKFGHYREYVHLIFSLVVIGHFIGFS